MTYKFRSQLFKKFPSDKQKKIKRSFSSSSPPTFSATKQTPQIRGQNRSKSKENVSVRTSMSERDTTKKKKHSNERRNEGKSWSRQSQRKQCGIQEELIRQSGSAKRRRIWKLPRSVSSSSSSSSGFFWFSAFGGLLRVS